MAYFEKKYDSSVKQEMQNTNKFSKQEGDCMDLGLRAGQSPHFYFRFQLTWSQKSQLSDIPSVNMKDSMHIKLQQESGLQGI